MDIGFCVFVGCFVHQLRVTLQLTFGASAIWGQFQPPARRCVNFFALHDLPRAVSSLGGAAKTKQDQIQSV